MTLARASGPPVEDPMASTANGSAPGRAVIGGPRRGGGLGAVVREGLAAGARRGEADCRAGTRSAGARTAPRILGTSCDAYGVQRQ